MKRNSYMGLLVISMCVVVLGFVGIGYANHQGYNCLVCHDSVDTRNLSLIREVIFTPNSGPKEVWFTSHTGWRSFADGDLVYDGVCEVCHTNTRFHTNYGDETVHFDGQDCTDCHPHTNDFYPIAVAFRPNRPVMDYVPQNIGIIDKTYPEFTELDCRECHGSSTAVRHHNTEPALSGNCLFCHVEGYPPPIVRDCKMCHTSDPNVYPEFYAIWGDLGNPHHKTDFAEAGQCNQCHDPSLIVEAYSVPPPAYAPGPNTPTPASCENCHFWDDPVNPTIHGAGHIETWGPTGAGVHPLKLALGFDPDNLPSMGTHEEINGMVYSQCALCHWGVSGNQWDTNPYNPQSIRFCENCHTMDQLHNNPEHVNTNNIYTVNGVLNQEVTSSEKCIACHGNIPPIALLYPTGGEVIPSGSTYTITWGTPPEAVKFTLRYSINNGSTWKLIAKNITGTSYDWTVPIPNNNKKNCLVKVIGFNSSGTKVGEDISDSTFTIEVVKLTSPDGGETLTSGSTHTITWRTNGTIRPVANVKLFKTLNGGSTWTLIKTLTSNPGSYNWTVPNVTSSTCKVKVVLKDSGGVTVGSDISDGVFTIQP